MAYLDETCFVFPGETTGEALVRFFRERAKRDNKDMKALLIAEPGDLDFLFPKPQVKTQTEFDFEAHFTYGLGRKIWNQFALREAVVQLAYAEALDSEKLNKRSEAVIERKKAYDALDVLWKPFAEQRANAQSRNRPFFEVPDFFGTPSSASQDTGNFNYLN